MLDASDDEMYVYTYLLITPFLFSQNTLAIPAYLNLTTHTLQTMLIPFTLLNLFLFHIWEHPDR